MRATSVSLDSWTTDLDNSCPDLALLLIDACHLVLSTQSVVLLVVTIFHRALRANRLVLLSTASLVFRLSPYECIDTRTELESCKWTRRRCARTTTTSL
jgi:hypothetical protein